MAFFMGNIVLENDKKKLSTDKVNKPAMNNIILFNDDLNTFEFVSSMLIEICNHEPVQAEQCTYLVHYSGKCSVKTGTYENLKPILEALLNNGLTASIE